MYFISNHKRLTIGIILYIAVFIVSSYISPWQVRDVTLSDFEISESNMVMDKIPINIIYFGIYELSELLIYAETAYESSGLMFFITSCAVFSYIYFLKRYIIIDECLDSFPHKIALDFIYDNILAYIVSLLVFYLYKPVAGKVSQWVISDNVILRAVTIIGIAVFIVVPSIPQLLNMLAYIFSVMMITKLLNYIDESLEWHIVFKTIFIVLVALISFAIVNIFINVILEKLQDMLLSFLSAAFPVFISLTLLIIKLIVKLVIALAIIGFFLWGLAFILGKFV